MNSRPSLDVYVMDWHLTESPAFKIIFETSLSPFINLNFKDIKTFGDKHSSSKKNFAMFLQTTPPLNVFDYYETATWVPMWDNIAYSSFDKLTSNLPRNIKIVALSKKVESPSQKAGFRTFTAQFFLNPDNYAASKLEKRTLFYWNRKSLYTKQQLHYLCDALSLNSLFFRDKADYTLPQELRYKLGKSLGTTEVRNIPRELNRDDYLGLLQQSTLFLAPRLFEGVGLAFLEAMAMGCVVIASDTATMNEYIRHGETGFLLPTDAQIKQECDNRLSSYYYTLSSKKNSLRYHTKRLLNIFPKFQSPVIITNEFIEFMNSSNWIEIGTQARQNHYEGYRHWQQTIPQLAEFILTQ